MCVHGLIQWHFVSNPCIWQRCSSKSNGDLYAASVPSHLQGIGLFHHPLALDKISCRSSPISKPLLLLALEEYFKSPFPETLEHLYNAVNSMDLSLMPRLSMLERHILLASDTKDLFVEKFDQMIQQRLAEEVQNDAISSPESPSKSSPSKSLPSKSSPDLIGHRPRYAVPRVSCR